MIIKSPINYTGNKYTLMSQIIEKIDTKNKVFVDMCSGGATVGINISSAKEVHFIEKNKTVVELLTFLGTHDFEKLTDLINLKIKYYDLSNSFLNGTNFYKKFRNGNRGLKDFNNDKFIKLRNDYNKLETKASEEGFILLYLLIIYGFNNEMRFNKKGEFNIPCGKTDFSQNNYNKIRKFNQNFDSKIHHLHNIDCFSNEALKLYDSADVIYIDPPYLITTAGYNENNSWTEQNEFELLKLIEDFISKNKKVYLSNVLRIDGKENKILIDWCSKNKNYIKIHKMEKHYRSSSYNKIVRGTSEEVLIEVIYENKQ